ncbi:helix-turn-helix domain-containing protein [Flagellimonas sp. S174]|uniref:helix-turn-helix domain-containing protein n=1 Tax=Flagellimonas sp. S174 TaxID=3410790 RepID=UPI003BF51D92
MFLFIFMLIGLINGLLIGFYLLLKKTNSIRLKWVALATILFCLTKAKEFLFVFGPKYHIRTPVEDFFQFEWLIPPLLIFSVKKVLSPSYRINYWLLLPGFVLVLVISPLFVLRIFPHYGWLNAYLPIIIDSTTFLWLILIFIRYKKNISVKPEVYTPLYIFTLIFGVLLMSRIAQIISMSYHEWWLAGGYKWWFFFRLILTSALVYVLSLALIYVYFKKRRHIGGSFKINDVIDEAVLTQIEKDKFYLRNNITLENVATRYGVSSKALSNAIRHYRNMGYNTYLNNLRIDFFLQSLESGKLRSITIYGLAEEAGFNSKATFIRAFKKRFQLTPSEYIKTHF